MSKREDLSNKIEGDLDALVDSNVQWLASSLAELSEYVTVGFVGPMASQYIDSGVIFLRSQNIVPFSLKLDDVKYVSKEFHEKLKKSALSPGDVVIVRTGKPGACAVVPEGIGACNCSDLVIARPNDRLDSNFLCYYINSVTGHYVSAHLVGAVQQHFNVGSAKKMEIPLPPLKTQQAIAHILVTIDKKIDLNRRMNETLKAMMQTLFKSWFVDFDPVKAKMKGDKPVWMEADTAELFPDSFESSALGDIPEGWKVSTLGAEIKVVGGGTPSTKNPDFWDGGSFCWATPKDLSGALSPILLDTSRKITEAGLGKISSGLLPVGSLLLSSRAPIGYLAIAESPVAINQGFIAIKPTESFSNYWMLAWCTESIDAIKANANGSTFLEISKKNFKLIKFVRPDQFVVEAYDLQVNIYFEKMAVNLREITTLTSLRNTLLPKVLSGDLSVAEVEKMLEAEI